MKFHSKNVCFFIFEQWMHNSIFFSGKKPIPYQRGGDFLDGHWIFFKILLFGNVLWTTTRSLMAIEKL